MKIGFKPFMKFESIWAVRISGQNVFFGCAKQKLRSYMPYYITPSKSEIICGQNVGTKVVCGMILFFEKKAMLKI